MLKTAMSHVAPCPTQPRSPLSGESLSLLCRNGGVALNERSHDASCGFNAQR
jgi:hypothetical protein